MADPERFALLVATVGGFHLTDRAMRGAQERAQHAVAAGAVDDATARAYLDAVGRYFGPFEREAQGQLRHVDRELERLYQLEYNLSAERGVVTKRIDAVRGVLAALAELRAG